MVAKDLVSQHIIGALNGLPGVILDAKDPASNSQGSGIECLVRWISEDPDSGPNPPDEWCDAGDLEFDD